MILRELKRERVKDGRLWEMIEQVNKLTRENSYESWEDNAGTLVPLMERVLLYAREKGDWETYFCNVAQLLWLVQRRKTKDISRAFKLAEFFHRDYALGLAENDDGSGFRRVDAAALILDFYREYPQIDDEKIEVMLGIFRNLREWKGGGNYSNYAQVMKLAFLNRDKELAEEAKEKVEKVDGRFNCYVCFYGKPMLEYYVLHEDEEGILEMVARIRRRSIPIKYHWCFDKCSRAKEEELKSEVLQDCLNAGHSQMFARLFQAWKQVFEEPETGEIWVANKVFFHSLAGDWSRLEERLRLAEQDDRDRQEGKETPLESLYRSLCWYCYFRMLDKRGVKAVWMKLGEEGQTVGAEGGEAGISEQDDRTEPKVQSGEAFSPKPEKGCRKWACLEAAEYFEKQADALGGRMAQARKRFDYAGVKRTYEECLPFRFLNQV